MHASFPSFPHSTTEYAGENKVQDVTITGAVDSVGIVVLVVLVAGEERGRKCIQCCAVLGKRHFWAP